jgi:hypothetical protein
LSFLVVNNTNRGREAEFPRAAGHGDGVFWMLRRSNDRIDVDLKLGVAC